MASSILAATRNIALGVGFIALAVGADAAAAAAKYTVTLSQMRFGAVPAGVHVGDMVTFVNKDTVPHTVTARDNSFNLRIAAGQQATLRLTKAGTVNFYCVLHPAMRGTLKVS